MKHDRQIASALLVMLVGLLAALPVQAQTVRYVATTGSDTGDCTDEETPCATVGYALDQATDGDTLEVADGEYTETLDINKDISLHGESEESTIIQAAATPGTATHRVLSIQGEFDVDIADLTIRHGVASGDAPDLFGGGIYLSAATLTITNVTFNHNEAEASGGGMFIDNSSPALTNITFTENAAGLGGGIYNSDNNAPTLLDVDFIENEAGVYAGGMYNGSDTSPTLENVVFRDNESGFQGGGMYNDSFNSSPSLTNVVFSGNTADQSGGGMMNLTNTIPTLVNVTFNENEAQYGGGMLNAGSLPTLTNVVFSNNLADFGGGMYNDGSSPTLTNVVFRGNEAVGTGGGLHNSSSSPNLARGTSMLTNVTFSGNSAGNVGGGIRNGSDFLTLKNTIVWGNTAGNGGNEIYNGDLGSVDLAYSLYGNEVGDIMVESGEVTCTGDTCLNDDPLFADAENGNLQLTEGSPAIDAGDPATDPALFPTNEADEPIDLNGDPRFFGDAIDMGADEWQGSIADERLPEELAGVLGLPLPNPASGSTSLSLRVAKTQEVIVVVFDALGRRVKTLYDGALPAGTNETLTLDASALPAGVYLIRATGENFVKTRRVTVMR